MKPRSPGDKKHRYSDAKLRKIFEASFVVADQAAEDWGAHPSCEFTCCRIGEECGELLKAATSGSEERPRTYAMEEETMDLFAMIIRLFREWPDGTSVR